MSWHCKKVNQVYCRLSKHKHVDQPKKPSSEKFWRPWIVTWKILLLLKADFNWNFQKKREKSEIPLLLYLRQRRVLTDHWAIKNQLRICSLPCTICDNYPILYYKILHISSSPKSVGLFLKTNEKISSDWLFTFSYHPRYPVYVFLFVWVVSFWRVCLLVASRTW